MSRVRVCVGRPYTALYLRIRTRVRNLVVPYLAIAASRCSRIVSSRRLPPCTSEPNCEQQGTLCRIQGTFRRIKGTFRRIQGTFRRIQRTFRRIQGTFSRVQFAIV
jgi:hypothetical protein